MSLSLTDILPGLTSGGLAGSGFFFGAGTSFAAGYPLMKGLTQSVVNGLGTQDREALDEVLQAASLPYDPKRGEPNIEVIADHVTSHAVDTGLPRFNRLEERLRELVTDVILSVESPRLDEHVAFLTALSKRCFGQAACVYVITTNYDLLFELAGAEANVVVETGFVGSVERFFDPQRFSTVCGVRRPTHMFTEHPKLTVMLLKLHGSVSWTARDGRVFERHPKSIDASQKRVMILPRRRKVMDTLQRPHDALFAEVSRTLGSGCKYVASCGFSFGDEHINDTLLRPAVSTGRIRLFALSEYETEGMKHLKQAPAFSAGFSDGGITTGTSHTTGTSCWKFGEFVNLF